MSQRTSNHSKNQHTSQNKKHSVGAVSKKILLSTVQLTYRILIAEGDTHAIVDGKAYLIESSSENELSYIFTRNNNKKYPTYRNYNKNIKYDENASNIWFLVLDIFYPGHRESYFANGMFIYGKILTSEDICCRRRRHRRFSSTKKTTTTTIFTISVSIPDTICARRIRLLF